MVSKASLSQEELIKRLSENDFLHEVPLEQLRWFASRGVLRELAAGEIVLQKDAPLTFLFLILKGLLQLKQEQQGEYRIMQELGPGDISGALPYSRAKKSLAVAQAREDTLLFTFPKAEFAALIQEAPDLTTALVHVMTSRVRDFTHHQQQTEKLASLGRLSAGLHHELNNPAAAALRAATELREQLLLAPERFKNLLLLHLSEQQASELYSIIFSKQEPASQKEKLSLLERSGLEDDITDWLQERGLQEADAMAETFSHSNIGLEVLKKAEAICGPQQFVPLMDWLHHLLATGKLAADIQESTKRISALVGAVKSYSHMDRSPERELTDLEAAIRNTLTILNYKLKNKKIKAEVVAAPNLPQACVYAGELNQVWTNLIDNAIDAMKPGGELNIRLQEQDQYIEILIRDNGSGIPAEIQEKIFDPFYTTKAMGEGTGMGLDIVKKIVERHGGSIGVVSKPGETEFKISIPLNL